jgi:hypothetical protein
VLASSKASHSTTTSNASGFSPISATHPPGGGPFSFFAANFCWPYPAGGCQFRPAPYRGLTIFTRLKGWLVSNLSAAIDDPAAVRDSRCIDICQTVPCQRPFASFPISFWIWKACSVCARFFMPGAVLRPQSTSPQAPSRGGDHLFALDGSIRQATRASLPPREPVNFLDAEWDKCATRWHPVNHDGKNREPR